MMTPILITVLVVLLVFVIFVSVQPSQFRVTRSATINAPPAVVFAQVNELRNWEAWNPWGKLDPSMKLTYSGPAAGKDASYAWVGNNQVGEGRSTIIESRPPEHVRFKLEFFKPMAGVCDTVFSFKPQGSQTEVTWDMTGQHNFIAKAMSLFISMDKMIGSQFEKGLADMKQVAEASGAR